jgi:predicted O-methyltransferase YrrM
MMFNDWYDVSKRSRDPHKGMVITAQIDWELGQLIEIFDELKPQHVLEIGSQFGGTLYYWLTGVEEGARVVNIDILQNMSETDKKRLPMEWMTWAPKGVVYHCLIGRSDDPAVLKNAMKYLDNTIDFLFIDALHSYEGAKYDFNTYGPLVRKGGVIVLHDLVTPEFAQHIQVGKLWREIQDAGYITQELRAGATYGGIGVVYV